MIYDSIESISLFLIYEEGLDVEKIDKQEVINFVLDQLGNISKYYRIGILLMTYLLLIYGFIQKKKLFVNMKYIEKKEILEKWSNSNIPMSGTLTDFYKKISVFGAYSEILKSMKK